MDATKQALYTLLEYGDEIDFVRVYSDKYGIVDEGAYRNLLHLQGAINALVARVECDRDAF